MGIGDYVVHNTFPPAEGYVSMIQSTVSGIANIAVMQCNGTLFWDDETSWDVVRSNENNKQAKRLNDIDIIDVEYTVIDEEE